MNWAENILPSLGLSVWGALTMIWAGNKRRSAWVWGVLLEVAWVAYAIWLKQWGFLPGAAIYAAVYTRNWIKWRPSVR